MPLAPLLQQGRGLVREGKVGEWIGFGGGRASWAVGSASLRASERNVRALGTGSGVGAEKNGVRCGVGAVSLGCFVWEGRGGEATGKSRLGRFGGR